MILRSRAFTLSMTLVVQITRRTSVREGVFDIWSISLNLAASVIPGCLQPKVGFGPSFSHSWLDTPGTMAHFALRDEREQPSTVMRGR